MTRSLANIKEFLRYDPETGEFRWIRRVNSRAAAGQAAGCRTMLNGKVYLTIGWGGEFYLAHRVAWWWMTGSFPVGDVDHRDRDGLNNAWRNLRASTRSQNMGNSAHGRGTSRFKGVARHSQRPQWWMARISKTYIGLFATEEEAARAYDTAARARYGEFALTNFTD